MLQNLVPTLGPTLALGLLAALAGLPAVAAAQDGTDPHPSTDSHHHGPQKGHQHPQAHHGEEHAQSGGHPVIHDFSDAERWHRIFDAAERDEWQKPSHVVHDLMAVEAGMTVADIGAGTGYFLPALSAAAGAAGRVLALDPETTLVRFIQQRAQDEGLGNVSAAVIPYDDPGVEAGTADRILIVNTWHHIGERVDYSQRLRKALAPGGAVYVVDFTADSPKGPAVAHRLPPAVVMEELAAAGLEVETLEEQLPWQYVVVGRRPAESAAH